MTVESYSFNTIGNRTDGGFTATTARAALNEYSTWTTDSGTTLSINYNNRGDTTSDGIFTYGYDAEDRMTSAEAVDHSVEAVYTYDAQSHLTSETVWTGYDSDIDGYTHSVITKFSYNGDELIAELDGSNNVIKTYQYGIGIDGKVGALISITCHGARQNRPARGASKPASASECHKLHG